MTQGVEMLPVEQSDRDFAADYNRMLSRVTQRDADNIRCGWWDETREVQEIVRHRLNHTHPAATGSVREAVVRIERFVSMMVPQMSMTFRRNNEAEIVRMAHDFAEIRALAAAPTPDAAASEAGEVAALAAELRPLIDAAAGPNGWDWMFPLRVKPVDGKPTIVSHKGGNLFRGYIGTWQEADFLVALANAAPRIVAALTTQGRAEE